MTGAAERAGQLPVTAELSLYPLSDQYLPAVVTFIRVLQRFAPPAAPAPGDGVNSTADADKPGPPRLSALTVNQLSTQISGALAVVQQAIAEALAEVDAAGYRVSLNIKLLNTELDLNAPVDLQGALDH